MGSGDETAPLRLNYLHGLSPTVRSTEPRTRRTALFRKRRNILGGQMAPAHPRKARYWLHFLWIAILSVPLYAQTSAPVIETDHGPNAAEQQAKHYVVLVSLDGFRYDYAQRYGAKNLLALASDGATAPDGMIPSYTSLTFPNHLAIVTGLYPEH